jgi:nitroreductase
MEFDEVLRRRQMCRYYLDRPIDPDVLDRVIAAGLRAPSAGYSQGYALLVLTSAEDRARFWDVTDTEPTTTVGWPPEMEAGMKRAPVIAVALSCKRAYLDRYARDDKGWTDRDEARWPVPYWHIDTGMVALLMLLKAVDEGLGALFMGVQPEVIPAFKAAFGVPDDHDVVGAVSLGHPDPAAPRRDLRSRRRSPDDVVHVGRW